MARSVDLLSAAHDGVRVLVSSVTDFLPNVESWPPSLELGVKEVP